MKINSVQFIRGMVKDTDLPTDGLPHVAFVGRSNVGKSSLINCLMGDDVCRTSKTPGRTQQANIFLVNKSFYLVDLPGYGFAKLPQEQREKLRQLIDGYLGDPDVPLKHVVLVTDASVPFSNLDGEMISFLLEHGRSVTVAANKWDKLNQKEQHVATQAFARLYPDVEWVPCAGRTGLGKVALLKALND